MIKRGDRLEGFLKHVEGGLDLPITPVNMRQVIHRADNERRRLIRIIRRITDEFAQALELLPEPTKDAMFKNLPADHKAEADTLAILMKSRIDAMHDSLDYDGLENA